MIPTPNFIGVKGPSLKQQILSFVNNNQGAWLEPPTMSWGVELIVNGSFSSGNGWTCETGWSVANGKAVCTAAAQGKLIINEAQATAGNGYSLSFESVTTSDTNGASPQIGPISGGQALNPLITSLGSSVGYSLATVSGAFALRVRIGTHTGTFDNFSVRRVYIDQSIAWTDNTGTTATALAIPTQTVGLLLDQSRGIVLEPELGPELITNGTFDINTSGWSTTNCTLAVVAGELEVTGTTASAGYATQSITTVAGALYKIIGSGRVGTSTTGSLQLRASDSSIIVTLSIGIGTPISANQYFVAKDTVTTIRCSHSNAVVGVTMYFDNISIKQVAGNHAYQVTAANRPTYQLDANSLPLIRHDTTDYLTISLPAINVRRNLLGYTNNFTGTNWVLSGTIAVESGNSINLPCPLVRIKELTNNGYHYSKCAITGAYTAGSTYTASVYAKAGERVQLTTGVFGAAIGVRATFNLNDGTVYSTTNCVAAIVNKGYGVFRCSITYTSAADHTGINHLLAASGSAQYQGDGVSGLYLGGAQLELGSTATDYQKITDWTSEAYASSGSVYFATPQGMSSLHNQSMGTTYNLPALSTDVYAWCVLPQRLNAAQEAQLERYMLQKAGLAEPDYLWEFFFDQLAPLNQTTRKWTDICALGSDVYACVDNGDIYKQTNGTGDFVALGQTTRNWYSITSLGSDVYACANNGDIYKQTGGTGDFIALNQTSRAWYGMTTLGSDVYASVYNGDIYKQTNGTGDFVALNQTTRVWGLMTTIGSDVYCVTGGGDIYKQTNGTGNFVGLGQTGGWWSPPFKIGNDLFSLVSQGGLYRQENSSGSFVFLNQTSRFWNKAIIVGSYLYASVWNGDIYKVSISDVGYKMLTRDDGEQIILRG